MSEEVYSRPDWDEYYLSGVIWAATRADCRRARHGAVIVDPEKRVISTGYNGSWSGGPSCLAGECPRGLLSYSEVPTFTSYDEGPGRCISTHAEANALIIAAGREVRGATMYVTGEPCPSCYKLIRTAGIVRLVYGPPNDFVEIDLTP